MRRGHTTRPPQLSAKVSFCATVLVCALLGTSASCGRSRSGDVKPPHLLGASMVPSIGTVGDRVRLECLPDVNGEEPLIPHWQILREASDSPEKLDGVIVSWTPPVPGMYSITCTVTNASGSDTRKLFFRAHSLMPPRPVIIKPANNPPIVRSVACEKRMMGGKAQFKCNVDAVDPDGDRLVCGWTTTFGHFSGFNSCWDWLTFPTETTWGGEETARIHVDVVDMNRGRAFGDTSVTVSLPACPKATMESTPTIYFKAPRYQSPADLAAELRASGVHEDDAGVFRFPDTDGGEIFDPQEPRTPADSLAACNDQIRTCVSRTNGKYDECIKAVTRCETNTPWLGDPKGLNCCPKACIREYFARRRESCLADVVTDFLFQGCIPGAVPSDR